MKKHEKGLKSADKTFRQLRPFLITAMKNRQLDKKAIHLTYFSSSLSQVSLKFEASKM